MTIESQLPALGLGTAPLGGLYVPVERSVALNTVQTAVAQGYRYFDTAPYYGYGDAERVVGDVLAEHPSMLLSTKVGRIIEPDEHGRYEDNFRGCSPGVARFDFSRDGIKRSFEDSLIRLKRTHVDLALIHDPDNHADQAIAEAYPALEELRAEGLITWIGVGMNQWQVPLRFVRETGVDAVLVAGRFTLLDQSATPLLDEAAARGVSVIIGGVYNSGVLAPTSLAPTFDYSPASPDIVQRMRRLHHLCENAGIPLAAAAMQYPLRAEAVSTVVVGARTAAEASANWEYSNLPISGDVWEELDYDINQQSMNRP